MSGIIFRFVVFTVIGLVIFWGVRRIWRDWTRQFRNLDAEQHARDVKERQRPDVIDLKRSKDGVFRPPGDEGR